jgi:hypothetical protein
VCSASALKSSTSTTSLPRTRRPRLGPACGTFVDATPFNVAASFRRDARRLPELAVRYEDFDDSDNTTAITIGANWYLQGHAAKWQANYVTVAADTSANEFDLIQVGLTVSI